MPFAKLVSFSCGAAFLLTASLLAENPAQPRITLVEHTPTAPESIEDSNLKAPSSDPAVVRLARPGRPTLEAHRFLQTIPVGSKVSESVEIAFHTRSTLTAISANNDFHVLPGGTCRQGQIYQESQTCTVDVEFHAMGPGNRAGQLKFAIAESAQPLAVGLQGTTTGPALAFDPAQITTLPQSYNSYGDLYLFVPGDVTVDEGDNLYFSDVLGGTYTTNYIGGRVYMTDSSQNVIPIAGQGQTPIVANTPGIPGSSAVLNAPVGLAVDRFLETWIAESGNNSLDLAADDLINSAAGLGGTNAATCTEAKPCTPASVNFDTPYWVVASDDLNIQFNDSNAFYTFPYSTETVYDSSGSTIELYFQHPAPFAVDSTQDLYALFLPSESLCEIGAYSPTTETPWIAAGDGVCGYSGDGVLSQGAEMQDNVGGYAFDKAGDMYFADTGNNVLRRIDAVTGIIHTVAGDNALGAGYSGDGTPATQATLNFPWGIAVDSNGIIYTASYTAGGTGITPQAVLARRHPAEGRAGTNISNPTAPDAVIRKIGPLGQIIFPEWLVGSTTPASTILLTNVGNDDLTVTNQVLGGADPGDFTSDPATTTCNWTEPLPSGHSCRLGFVFKPTATGVRTATVTLADNTAAFQHSILLEGSAGNNSALIPTITITSPAGKSVFPSGTPIKFAGTITNGNPAPYGPTGNAVFYLIFESGPDTGGVWADLTVPVSNQGTVSTTATPPPGIFKPELFYNGDKVTHYNYTFGLKFAVTPVPALVSSATPTSGQVFPYLSNVEVPMKVESAILSALGLNSELTGTTTLTFTNTASNKNAFGATFPGGSNTGTESFYVDDAFLSVGSYTVTIAYLGDTGTAPQNGPASITIPFSVVPVTPTIVWPKPASVVAGTKLSSTQLDATASIPGESQVPGSFVYNPPAGTVLKAGTTTLNVAFTPTDTTDIKSATGSVEITVTAANATPATVTKLNSQLNPAKARANVELKAIVTSNSTKIQPSGTVAISENGTKLGTASLTSGVATIRIAGLTAGIHMLKAAYSGDSEHQPSTSEPFEQLVVSSAGVVPDPIVHKE